MSMTDAALKAYAKGCHVYAHLRVHTGGREADVLLGDQSTVVDGVGVLDWRHAALTEVLFATAPGEAYALDVDGRRVSGTLVAKHWLAKRDGGFTLEPMVAAAPLPVSPVVSAGFRSPLAVELDAAQRRIVNLPPEANVLVLGEAGFGKTTVALHRLLALKRRASASFRAAVIVPTEGLRRLAARALAELGGRAIDVFTFDGWAASLGRKHFHDVPARESGDASGGVVRLKRHGALAGVLAEYARQRPSPASDEEGTCRPKGRVSRFDLQHFFGDTAWLERVVAASGGAIPRTAIAEVAEHTRVQFLDPAELEFAYVDPERLEALDQRKLDEGTPTESAGSIDAEDFPVLFALERLRAEARGRAGLDLAAWDCIVLDEAQELSPLELALVGRARRPGGTLIVAGDAAQQVDPTADFEGWAAVMRTLGAEQHAQGVLEIGYRCPPEVTALARGVLAGQPLTTLETDAVVKAREDNPPLLLAKLVATLDVLAARDPEGTVAVIARTEAAARTWLRLLRFTLDARLALEGKFSFRPGVLVTAVPEVKGLEFDYVVVPDCDAASYPDTPESRRALYVAVTRTRSRLVLLTSGEPAVLA